MRAARPRCESPHRRHASGQVMVIFALFSLVLLGGLALSIDAGFLMAERRQSQSAADSGAMAAAIALVGNKPWSAAEAAGVSYASTNAGSGATVVLNRPPLTGDHAGDSKYVEAVVTKPVTKYFVGAIYSGTWQVSARAVAGIEPIKRPYALLALKAPGIYLNGTTNIFISGAGSAMSNGNISSSGGSNIFSAGGVIDANGTIQSNSNWSAPGGIRPNQPVATDPLLGTPPPPKGTTRSAPSCGSSDCTMQPGYYNNLGEIKVKKTATLSPGVYYFDGNTNLSMSDTNSWIKGTGVLLYFAGASQLTPGNGNIDLATNTTAPLYTGGKTGLVLWISNCTDFISGGNGAFRVEGVVYAPCSHVQLHGTPDSNGLQVIVGDLEIKGNSDFTINYRKYVVSDIPAVWLVE